MWLKIDFISSPPPTTSIEWGGGTPHACGSGRRSGATGVMLSGGDSLTASVPSYLPSSCLASLLLFISDKIEEYNFLVLVLTYKITTNRPTRSPFYSIENVTLPQAFISLFCMFVCVQFPPFKKYKSSFYQMDAWKTGLKKKQKSRPLESCHLYQVDRSAQKTRGASLWLFFSSNSWTKITKNKHVFFSFQKF